MNSADPHSHSMVIASDYRVPDPEQGVAAAQTPQIGPRRYRRTPRAALHLDA